MPRLDSVWTERPPDTAPPDTAPPETAPPRTVPPARGLKPVRALLHGCARRLTLALVLIALLGATPAPVLAEDEPPEVPRLTIRRLAAKAANALEARERDAALRALREHLVAHPAGARDAIGDLSRLLRTDVVEVRLAVLDVVGVCRGAQAYRLALSRLNPVVERSARVWETVFQLIARARADPVLARQVLTGLRQQTTPAARALWLEACGALEGPARARLHTPSAGETWVEAAGRARGLRRQSDRASLTRLIDLLRHPHDAVKTQAWESLVARSGHPLGRDHEAWGAWWAKGGPVVEATSRYDAGATAQGKGGHTPHYYGIPIPRPRARVVFCLDTSQSMYGDGIKFAREHLRSTLADLHSTQSFEIIAFHKDLKSFAGRTVRAHPVHTWRAIHWLNALETIAYTNLYDAAERAFGHAGRGPEAHLGTTPLDMIFLLSDGAPNRGRFRVAARIIKHLSALSGGTLPVHTIGVGRRDEALLRGIAEACGGRYVDVVE